MNGETLWPAPAKLNLFLHILGRRPDGYHELQTLFQLIDLCDTVAITLREDGRIERGAARIFEFDAAGWREARSSAELARRPASFDASSITGITGIAAITDENDLSLRAARALQAATGARLGASVRLVKRIPLGGGLGGGSSDAATTLVALNRLWGCGLSAAQLAEIGLALGADVPVFVHGSTAWGEGRGERLTPVELPERWYVIVHPGVSVATREVFQAPELTRNSPPLTIRAFFQAGGRNDCEAVVRACFPQVAQALDWLGQFASARLTGTGACVFAAFETAAAAERIAARVPDAWSSIVARGINVSPLREC